MDLLNVYRRHAIRFANRNESFSHLVKTPDASTRIHMSAKDAYRYVGEFSFRPNHRASD